MIESVLFIVITHFVADFLCQTDKMALNKSHSLKWLSLHVLTYTAVLGVSSTIFMQAAGWGNILLFIGMNGGLHFITDFFTSKATSRLYKLESKHWFFVMIGLDQMIHYLCLFLTLEYIENSLPPPV
ncbi:MAG: DUF3307 domain-containing protein [Bacteroidia bacterium]|nr:DUF3307 domain-containing protein [Bacteroidia bacterium]